jgi:RNA polymerase sigma-70 factor (ECF subfamily)
MATARNRIADLGRHSRVVAAAEEHLALLEEERMDAGERAGPDRILSLMFVCAHPAIDASMRTPLMLQLVLGLDARRMAGAFLVPPGTLVQGLTRARAKIETARIGFSLPQPEELPARLNHDLDAIYAAYTVGADGHAAGDAKSSMLAQGSLWLASVVASQMPGDSEAQALFALLLYCEARRPARRDAGGGFVPLADQDPALWDRSMIHDADCAMRLASANATLGRFQLEAAVQAAHAVRRTGRSTDWTVIAELYRGLVALYPTTGAITALAAAVGEAQSPEAAISILETADREKRANSQPLWAFRAHMLRALGDAVGSAHAYERAIALTADPAVRVSLVKRKLNLA